MKITVDSITYEVEDANFVKLYQNTAKELEVLKADAVTKSTELDKATTDLAELNAKADTLKDDNDKLKSEKETLEKADHSEEITKAVKSRIDLERTAEKAGVEIKEDSSDDDLKKAVILTVYPNAKEKLDACDSVYLNARFDGAIESIDSASGNAAFTGDTLHEDAKPKGKTEHNDSGKDAPRTAAQARADMINRSKKASERKED